MSPVSGHAACHADWPWRAPFLLAALRYYKALGVHIEGVMTDNGSAYRSRRFAKLLRRLGIKHLRTRP